MNSFFLFFFCALNIIHVSCSNKILQWLSQNRTTGDTKVYKHTASILYVLDLSAIFRGWGDVNFKTEFFMFVLLPVETENPNDWYLIHR